MADWSKIKAEYIRDEKASYRNLSKKYEVPLTTLRRRAEKEKWLDLRAQRAHKANTRVVEACATKEADQAIAFYEVADIGIARIKELMQSEDIGAVSLKQLSSALRDLAAIKGLQTEAEKREQEARIAKLRRDAEGDDRKDNSYTIEFARMDWDKDAETDSK